MAKQIEGVYDRILACAKREFLEKGYADASLRAIAAGAATSTNSIYVRFKDKEGLFTAIVEPTLHKTRELFASLQETFHGANRPLRLEIMKEHSFDGMKAIVDDIYDHFDDFRLLLDASHGTRFHNFVDELVRSEVEYATQFMKTAGLSADVSDDMLQDLLHIVVTSYLEGMFEVVRHRMSREDAQKYVAMLGKYHHAGFAALFHGPKE